LHNGLNRTQEEIANDMLRDYKKNRSNYAEMKITLEDEIVIPYEIKMAEISFTEELEPIVEATNVYEGMTDEEIKVYKEHKQKRNERVFEKFRDEEKYR
jgi:predicted methyltransferase